MPWRDRARKLLGNGSKERDDNDKNKDTGRSNDGEIFKEAHADVTVTGNRQHIFQDSAAEVPGSTEDGSNEPQLDAPPTLNLPTKNILAAEQTSNERTDLAGGPRISAAPDPKKQSLFDKAYEYLWTKEPDLMEAYEKDLLSFQPKDKQGIPSNISLSNFYSTIYFLLKILLAIWLTRNTPSRFCQATKIGATSSTSESASF